MGAPSCRFRIQSAIPLQPGSGRVIFPCVLRRLLRPAFLLGLAPALIFGWLSLTPFGQTLENHVFDAWTRASADPSKWPDDIVVVLIDDASLEWAGKHFSWRWPWPRSAYPPLLAAFKKAGARDVILDILFTEPSEARHLVDDDRFAAWLSTSGNVSLVALQHADKSVSDPIPALRDAVKSRVGFADALLDADGVIRRYPVRDFWKHTDRLPLGLVGLPPPSPHSDPTMLLRWHAACEDLDEKHRLSAGKILSRWEPLLDAALAHKKEGFDEFDPADLSKLIEELPDDPELSHLRGKTVFLGTSAAGASDIKNTPIRENQPGVLAHATARATWLRHESLNSMVHGLRLLLIFGISFGVSVFCDFTSKLRWQASSTALILAAVFGASWLLFRQGGWLPPLLAAVSGTVSFTCVTAYHYFTEGRKRRVLHQLFSDFVSEDVLDEILSSDQGVDLQGEAREGTILFCDLEGFTALGEKMEPHEFFEAINGYLSEASAVLQKHGAYVDKFIGDAVMAIFGAPKAQPNHARQACLAALELQRMIQDMSVRYQEKYDCSLSLRVGINTGNMRLGTLGSAGKKNYTALGDNVNLASRLEGANKAYHTRMMLGPLTYEQAKESIEARPLDRLKVKGKTRPVEVYELLGPKGVLTPEQGALRQHYHRGLEAYRKREWESAGNFFDEALRIRPEDGPSLVYRERCLSNAKTPPPADWDGSFALDTK